jgi:hypothetical protein
VFVYPRSKRTRMYGPPHRLPRYQDYKPLLKVEFEAHCVYCLRRDALSPYNDNFGVDHYRPRKLFPHLEREYSNLFYACNRCNATKGSFWRDSAVHPDFIPNPCDHVMAEHLSFHNTLRIVPLSPAGECAVEILRLDDPTMITYRQEIRSHIIDNVKRLGDLEAGLAEVAELESHPGAADNPDVRAWRRLIEDDMERTRENLRRLGAAV